MSKQQYAACAICGVVRATRQNRTNRCVNCRYQQVAPAGDWMAAANCSTVDPEIFFNDSNSPNYHNAIAVCHECPVSTECLNYAIDNNIRHGVWGGLTPNQRGVIARAS